MKPDIKRNNQIVALRNSNPKEYTYQKLADKFGVSVITIWEIYHREMARNNRKHYDAPNTLKKKYCFLND